MSAKNFRFRSPGVRIEEIDESLINVPIVSEVGPVIIGRSQHGPMLKPVIVSTPDEFTRTFGSPSPGGFADTDIWRGENRTAPDYGAYAALAYLRNSAPVTFIRLGGDQSGVATGDNGKAGWTTTVAAPTTTLATNGGAYGLWLFPSGTATTTMGTEVASQHGTGSLAAVFYTNSGSAVLVSGSDGYQTKRLASFSGDMTTAAIKLRLSASARSPGFRFDSTIGWYRDVAVKMDPGASNFVRKAFKTSPILTNSTVVDSANVEGYWLGETFEGYIKQLATDNAAAGGATANTLAFISPLTNGTYNKGVYRYPFKSAKTGYVFGQDLGAAGSFNPVITTPQQLFRIVGLTEGRWASKNIKISISNVSYTKLDQDADPYGTFNVEVRAVFDTDESPILLETFEECNLNPRSARFIARVIGDQYLKWNATNNKVEVYGDYPNQSKYVRVELHANVKDGGANPKLLPFGFLGPARRQKFQIVSGAVDVTTVSGTYVPWDESYTYGATSYGGATATNGAIYGISASGSADEGEGNAFTASLNWPDYLLRVTASNASRGVASKAYFGVRTSLADTGRFPAEGYFDFTYPLDNAQDSWVVTPGQGTEYNFAFSLDDVRQLSSSTKGWEADAAYATGQRAAGTSITATGIYYRSVGPAAALQRFYSNTTEGWKTVLDAGYNSFTLPMHGGFDGVDIKQKNPFSITNVGTTDGGEGQTNYAYFSVLSAVKMLRDPEFLDFNLAAAPGIVNATLNTKISDYCQERGDSLAILDLDSGYRPLEDVTPSTLTATNKRGTVSGAINYRANSISSVITSYASTFYPWVDIADGANDAVVTVPPTVAMMGVFGRVKQTSEVWFAPAGFRRGGLSDGSTGLRVLNVKDRLTSSERDALYDNGINPIANFPAEGIVVFGQKTLQIQRSALDRINVRRLMIYLKRQIGGVARNILFEQNLKDTWDNFTQDAVDILDSVQEGLGITDYKFVLDNTTTTPDLIDQNILYAKLFVKPARAIEFIALDFIITATGAEFPE